MRQRPQRSALAAAARPEEDLTNLHILVGRLAGRVCLARCRLGLERLGRVGLHAERNPREDVPVGAVVNLRPAIERVLVALRTLEPHAEERGRSLLAPLVRRQRLLATPEEVDRLFPGVGPAAALDRGVVYGPLLPVALLAL